MEMGIALFVVLSCYLYLIFSTYHNDIKEKRCLEEIPLLNTRLFWLFIIWGTRIKIKGQWKSKQVEITLYKALTGGVFTLIISFYDNIFSDFNMSIRKQRKFTGILIKEFWTRDVKIGDEEFDKRYRIQSRGERTLVINYLQDKKLRDSIEKLLNEFQLIKITGSYIQLVKDIAYRKDLNREKIVCILDNLINFTIFDEGGRKLS